jgi:dTMP kinase
LGFMIGIEGIDAVGKNTHSRLLCSWLREEGLDAIKMSFPDYHTSIGKEIKKFLSGKVGYGPELRHLLFAANRWEKKDEITSLLKTDKIIVVDRYTESNLAYGMANGLDMRWLENLERGLPRTKLVILLDALPKSLETRRLRRRDEYEKNLAMQNEVRRTYKELAKTFGWHLVSAAGPIKEVQESIASVVKVALTKEGIL